MGAKSKSRKGLVVGNQSVLVDFYATWCGPCKMMQPVLKNVASKLEGKVNIIKVDVDKNPSAANSYQVKSVPTLILFRNGKIVWRQSGVIRAPQLLQVVNQHLG